ncbi:MAG: hypothetical protein ACR2P7_02560 [bacterium]
MRVERGATFNLSIAKLHPPVGIGEVEQQYAAVRRAAVRRMLLFRMHIPTPRQFAPDAAEQIVHPAGCGVTARAGACDLVEIEFQ